MYFIVILYVRTPIKSRFLRGSGGKKYRFYKIVQNNSVGYFNYHAKAKKLIKDGKLKGYRFASEYNGIKDVLLLIFDDGKHPVMPIRRPRWREYFEILGIKTKE